MKQTPSSRSPHAPFPHPALLPLDPVHRKRCPGWPGWPRGRIPQQLMGQGRRRWHSRAPDGWRPDQDQVWVLPTPSPGCRAEHQGRHPSSARRSPHWRPARRVLECRRGRTRHPGLHTGQGRTQPRWQRFCHPQVHLGRSLQLCCCHQARSHRSRRRQPQPVALRTPALSTTPSHTRAGDGGLNAKLSLDILLPTICSCS